MASFSGLLKGALGYLLSKFRKEEPMLTNRWCLGFVFSSDLTHVMLIRKGRSMHIGKWNGVGGVIEEGETSLEAMVRECNEEANLVIERDRWVDAGALIGFQSESGSWRVDVFASKLKTKEEDLSIGYLVTPVSSDDKAILFPMDNIHKLSNMAPHTGALIHISLQAVLDPRVPFITMSV